MSETIDDDSGDGRTTYVFRSPGGRYVATAEDEFMVGFVIAPATWDDVRHPVLIDGGDPRERSWWVRDEAPLGRVQR
ncbi:MAG: hypothetical protein M3386_01460 [Actinomycetota bacterium]|nr:hypothetical protein [Actinomycetota bacterium]